MQHCGAAVIAVIAVLMATSHASASATATVAAAGTVELRGDGPGQVTVRLERDAVIDLRPSQRADGMVWPTALSASGGSGFVGFALVGTQDHQPRVVALRSPYPPAQPDGRNRRVRPSARWAHRIGGPSYRTRCGGLQTVLPACRGLRPVPDHRRSGCRRNDDAHRA